MSTPFKYYNAAFCVTCDQKIREAVAMTKIVLSAFSILFFLSTSIDCFAFRCGSGFVSSGDSKAKVLLECGKPTSKEKAGAKKKNRRFKNADRAGDQKRPPSYTTVREKSKPVEKWYYNCGDNDFIYILTFEGGTLKSEETGGYGKGKSACR